MFRSVLCVCMALISGGCSFLSSSAEEEKAQTMLINVDFQDRHRCSRISPEITVTNIPAGTRSFLVRLEESGDTPRILGGGTWENDNSGIIPEGALARYYQGACPRSGETGKYVFAVAAMGDDGQPKAVRTYKLELE